MPRLSTYTRYLPPVLWTAHNDPSQFLARWLRIAEKILTGPPVNGQVSRAFAPTVNSLNDRINLADPADAAQFRAGDIVTLEGTAERQPVAAIDAEIGQLILGGNLGAAHPAGTARVADLEVGQTTFRVNTDTPLGSDDRLLLAQGPNSEVVTVVDNMNGLLSIAHGLAAAYPMGADDMRVMLGDGQPLLRDGAIDPPVDAILRRLHLLANPWKTEAERLPWLSSWVALEIDPDWDEYQTRQIIASVVEIYRHRGLPRGLRTFLEIYALKGSQPRIAIDDGNALLRAHFAPGALDVEPYPLTQSHTVALSTGTTTVLLHPTGLAIDSLNRCIVADEGDVDLATGRPPAVWRVAPHGEAPFAPGPPVPVPEPLHSGAPLSYPRAVTSDGSDSYAVVDAGNYVDFFTPTSALFRFDPPNYLLTTVIDQTTVPTLPVVSPVDMILDGAGNYVILDRGGNAFGDPPFGPTAPQIVVVSEAPLTVTQHPLATVSEPSAIVMDDNGRFIVADVVDHWANVPVDLVRVDPAAGWTETSLLLAAPAADPNPLVTPVGMVMETADSLLICDSGLRWGYDAADPEGPDSAYRFKARSAALFRVDLSAAQATVTQISSTRIMVNPTGLAWDRNGHLMISDRGETQMSLPQRSWRAGHNEFGMVVHFPRDLPGGALSTFAERNRMRRGIQRVTDRERPAHSAWWMDF